MNKKIWNLIERYLTKKIGVEIKCCLMFLLILCFYCIYRWIGGISEASIIHMLEMVLLAYVIGWIQTLIHSDFDEIDHLRIKECLFIILCSFVYVIIAYLGNWFDKSIGIGIIYGFYMICAYLCTFMVYKIKRVIDAKHLNEDLKKFQERRLTDEKCN